MSVQRTPILVDQQVDPVLRIPTQRDLEMNCRLAQVSALNISDATGQGTITPGVAPASVTTEQLDVSGTIVDQWITTGYDILNPGDNLPIRVIGWKGFATGDVTLDFVVQDAAQVAFGVAVVPDTSTTPTRILAFRDINAP
jgi:hypothetical protein